jgi:hypothetical protein
VSPASSMRTLRSIWRTMISMCLSLIVTLRAVDLLHLVHHVAIVIFEPCTLTLPETGAGTSVLPFGHQIDDTRPRHYSETGVPL